MSTTVIAQIYRKYVHVIGFNPVAMLSLLTNCDFITFVHILMYNSCVMSGIVTYGQKKNPWGEATESRGCYSRCE